MSGTLACRSVPSRTSTKVTPAPLLDMRSSLAALVSVMRSARMTMSAAGIVERSMSRITALTT